MINNTKFEEGDTVTLKENGKRCLILMIDGYSMTITCQGQIMEVNEAEVSW